MPLQVPPRILGRGNLDRAKFYHQRHKMRKMSGAGRNIGHTQCETSSTSPHAVHACTSRIPRRANAPKADARYGPRYGWRPQILQWITRRTVSSVRVPQPRFLRETKRTRRGNCVCWLHECVGFTNLLSHCDTFCGRHCPVVQPCNVFPFQSVGAAPLS